MAERLRTAILDGGIPSGERLVELALAEEWQVSQGTIRAALKTLQHEGLVEVRPRRGTFVASVSEADLREIYTLRNTLEAFAARHAAERITPAGRTALSNILSDMQLAAKAGDRSRMLELDFLLHRTIIDLCQHGRLAAIYASLESQTRLFLSMTEVLHHDLDQSVAHHAPLIDAITRGDADLAHALASHHTDQDAAELIQALFSQSGSRSI